MIEYTPTTKQVRHMYVVGSLTTEDVNDFDRWLAEVKREVAARAYAEGYQAASPIRMGPQRNPYRKGNA